MMSAGNERRLQEIADRLRADDRRLARRLAHHRIRLRGIGVTHPWVRQLLAALASTAAATVAVVLMVVGLEIHQSALVVAGALVLVPIPFAPLLWTRRRATAGRVPPRLSGRRRAARPGPTWRW